MTTTLTYAPAATVARLPLTLTDHHGIALQRGERSWGYADVADRVSKLARGLMALGVERGDRVAILSSTRPEWTICDLAILATGAVTVPIYHTNSAVECAYVLEHSGAKIAICETAADAEKCPVDQVFLIDDDGASPTLDDLAGLSGTVSRGELHERIGEVRPDDLATIVYTSGTTGPPKGCMLTHANCAAAIEMYEQQVPGIDDTASVFMFLPLAHVLARVTQLVALDAGATIAYWSGDPTRLLDDIAAARPTHLPSVPRVFEKIHTKALHSRLVRLAIRHPRLGRPILAKVRNLFGGELQLAMTGAAPIATDVLEFFKACGLLVVEGYGMTETCAGGTLNTPDAYRFGTVGRPLPGTELAIAEDGEILLRGPSVFAGYYRDEDATLAALDGGWLLTGDLGAIDDRGFVRITGRKKDLIITSSGKNISPSNIEAMMRESPWISQAVVFGDNRPYLVALITLDPDEPIEGDARAVIRAEVDRVNAELARIEQIKRFTILDRDLTLADDELTPTLKVKRPVVARHFAGEVEALYR